MKFDLDGAVCVITGGGSGIGRASAHAFARRGARIIVADIDADRAATVAGELGDDAIGARCDVTDIGDLAAIRDRALERFGRVDLVMNNVGVLAVGPPEVIPIDAWERVIDINLMSVVRSNAMFLPLLLERGSGHVVNTASTAGLLPYGFDRLPYTATKHAIVGLSESLALYLAPKGIGVSCLCPAGVMTNILEGITFYGDPAPPRGPDFAILEPDVVGEIVAEGVTAGRFLILTAPEAADEIRERGENLDAYLARRVAVEHGDDR
jgi:NAD(P)-dependent dehydrogenase (short-subunit alcohol dehydrogenase family)